MEKAAEREEHHLVPRQRISEDGLCEVFLTSDRQLFHVAVELPI